MLLSYLSLSCFVIGTLAYKTREVCYGEDFPLDGPAVRPSLSGKLYFMAKDENERRLVIENGTSADPRFKITRFTVTLRDVTDKDDGLFSQQSGKSEFVNLVRLKVLECAEKVERWYDSSFRRTLPSGWEFVEFYSENSPYVREILLNRSDPSTHNSGRMRLVDGRLLMLNLARPDEGYYHIRSKDKLLSRINLVILIYYRSSEAYMEEDYDLIYPAGFTPWFVNFTRADGVHMLMVDGKWQDGVIDSQRLNPGNDRLIISHVEMADDGYYGFYDRKKTLVFFVKLTVLEPPFPMHLVIYVSVAVLIMLSCCICICVRRRCQSRKMKRRNAAALAAAAASPSYSAPSQQGTVGYSAAPAPAVSVNNQYNSAASGYSSVPAVDSKPPPAGSSAAKPLDPPSYSPGTNFLASDPPPTFESSSLTFPSAPAPSSESHVYNSDKLNFL